MKKKLCIPVAAIALVLGASNVEAVPFASAISIADSSVSSSEFPVNISYNLNEAADTVSIVVKDSGSAVVATFAGTTAIGPNTVAWNGTVDNAAGALVAEAAGYTIEITVDKTAAAGFTQIVGAGVTSAAPPNAPVFSGFSPRDIVIHKDPTSDLFGSVTPSSAYGAVSHAAHIVFRSDLKPADGSDGFASRVLKHPRDPLGATPGATASGTIWGTTFIPGTSDVLCVGQTGATGVTDNPAYVKGSNGSTFGTDVVNADPDGVLAAFINPRDIAVSIEGPKTYSYVTGGNATIMKVEYDGTKYVGTPFNILALTNTTLYSKDVKLDAAGNLYWLGRSGGTAPVQAAIYRWDASQIAALDDDLDPKLTEANATWAITPDAGSSFFTTSGNWMGMGISPSGDLYVSGGTSESVYLVGNVSTATLTKAMVVADSVLDLTTASLTIGTVYNTLEFDYAGNLIIFDPGPERIHSFSPGGTTSIAIAAPAGQTFDIFTPASVTNWNMME